MKENRMDKKEARIELTGIAEEIIDNFTYLKIKDLIIINRKDGWKSIRFDYKDMS